MGETPSHAPLAPLTPPDAYGEVPKDFSSQKTAQALLASVRSRGRLSEAELMKRVRGRKQTKVRALRTLLSLGLIFRTGSGRRADPYLYRSSNIAPIPAPSEQAIFSQEVFL